MKIKERKRNKEEEEGEGEEKKRGEKMNGRSFAFGLINGKYVMVEGRDRK